MRLQALQLTNAGSYLTARGLNAVAVFCGASSGQDDQHRYAAGALGQAMASRDISLVYGGSSCGLMGALADAVLSHGGKAIGVIPQALADHEIAHTALTELIVVDSMHSRKFKMASLSDAFIAMAGGFGTLDESFEALTWTQLGIHEKPLGFLNISGYYDHLLQFIDHQVTEGFVKPAHRDMIVSDDTPDALLQALSSVVVPTTGKWVNP